ncbi:cadherin-3 [Poecilia formosa]|uniref:cadherin-3 n=1 Tax=Poecilia formosa TaxID=48698 RepID=UPI00044483FD|nr:PREDICTED: cadherin-3-like [Poecilia formosa]
MLLLTLLIFLLPSPSCTAAQSRQKRDWIIDSYEIEEGNPGPFPYELSQVAVDRKYQVFFDLKGQGVDQDPKGVLRIEESTGKIVVYKPVDFEEYQVLKLSFEAKKQEDQSIDTRLGIEITIRDINDNPPLFDVDLYNVTVEEALYQGSHLLTVFASDRDKPNTRNSTFHYAIKSVSPESSNIEFVLKETGGLSFKGCFDYEVAREHRLVIEAIDHGEVIQLSSSTTVVIKVADSNDHLPVIIGQTGSGKVKENEVGVSPLRLHVLDKDKTHRKAWRAKYTIQGDKGGYFKMETNEETNDGILTVVKPLDFENGAMKNLKISVTNEAPYFSCKVKRQLSRGPWDVDFTDEQIGGMRVQPNTTTVVIEVEDVNDPPNFVVTVKEANLKEDAPIGTWVEKVTAVDRDATASSDFIYKVGHDPGGWMNIDPQTGNITTRKMVDRESDHVVNGVYTVILHAVDKGEPPMTGTATLQIHVIDVNDNVPELKVNHVVVCMSDNQTSTNISATDLDASPYGGPFKFELLGDVKGQWKLDPFYGFTAGLVRHSSVAVGLYTLRVKVSDLQGTYGIYKLNVNVCSCLEHHCRNLNLTISSSGAVAVALLLAITLFLLAVLALITISCKPVFSPMPVDETSEVNGYLMSSNEEAPGSDIKGRGDSFVSSNSWRYSTNKHLNKGSGKVKENEVGVSPLHLHVMDKDKTDSKSWTAKYTIQGDKGGHLKLETNEETNDGILTVEKLGEFSLHEQSENVRVSDEFTQDIWKGRGHSFRTFKHLNKSEECNAASSYQMSDEILLLLQRRISSLQEPMAELLDYEPQTYAEEGEPYSPADLGYLDISENYSLHKVLENLGPEFNELANCIRNHNHRD